MSHGGYKERQLAEQSKNASRIVENMEDLSSFLRANESGIVTVKPRVLFGQIEGAFAKPVPLNLYIPASGIGSITLLEGAILCSLIRITDPKRIFEFGTFLGYSTSLMLRNASEHCEVYSIDLGSSVADTFRDSLNYSDEDLHMDDKKNDDYLRYTQASRGNYYLTELDAEQKERLKLLYGDSTKLDVSSQGLSNNVDLVFIDGGHDYATICSDTQKALQMLGDSGVIVWHDYNSSIHFDVTKFVSQFARSHLVMHVQSTMLAISLVGSASEHFLKSGVS